MMPVTLSALLLLGTAAVAATDPARRLAQTVAPSIVHGQDSPRIGWYVSLGRFKNGTWASYCGGMLITQTTVLTAAHCVFNAEENVIKPATTVAVGIRSLDDTTSVDFATVNRTIVHPRYVPGPDSRFVGLTYDIALLELDPATVSGKNELVALPTYVPKPRNPLPAGTRLQLVGLGDLGNHTVATVLQRTELVLERLETCNEAYVNWRDIADFFKSGFICAGSPPTNRFTDACPGDSGGPLFAPRTVSRPYDTVIGLVSFGEECDILYNKTRYGRPGVFTNVAQLRPWVDANLACLARGKICPWGGTCFESPANGCATCQPGLPPPGQKLTDPSACATCAAPGYLVDRDVESCQYGQCRPKDCRDVVKTCIACSRHRRYECSTCNFGYKVENNKCVLKTCLDYDRNCQQCDPGSPVLCAVCKRNYALDTATGKLQRTAAAEGSREGMRGTVQPLQQLGALEAASPRCS